MGIMVYSLLWVMQDLYHQLYLSSSRCPYGLQFRGFRTLELREGRQIKEFSAVQSFVFPPKCVQLGLRSRGARMMAFLGRKQVVCWKRATK